MANITVPGLPAKTGTILDAAYLHLNESSIDKKVTIAQLLAKIEAQYSADIVTFLGSANKAEGRANLSIDRRVTVDDANYTILATDKVVAQIGTMSTARTFSLPAASTVEAGAKIIIIDESGSVDIVNKIIVQRSGTDIIDGQTSIDINKKYGQLELICDGTDSWKIVSSSASILQNNFINKNLIINGDFEIAQRGTSFISASPNYTLDRWAYGKLGTMAQDVTQDSDVPTGAQARRYIPNSVLFDCTTAQPSIGASDYSFTFQKIEGYNFQAIAQKTFTLSFWVKATKTGTYCISLRNSGFDRSYVAEYTVNSIDAWEFKTITVAPSPSTGTWNYTNGTGIIVEFIIAAGSNFHTTPNAWQTGSFLSTSNQVNGVASVSDQFRLAGVQVEVGSIATEFEKRNIQQEIELCQRYYEKSYDLTINPGSAVSDGIVYLRVGDPTSGVMTIYSKYQTPKRALPIITLYDNAGNPGKIGYSGVGNNQVGTVSDSGFNSFAVSTDSSTSKNGLFFQYIANSEL